MPSWEDKALYGAGGFKPSGSSPSVVPDEHYAAIGKVVDAWADFEFEVDRTIWDLLGEHQSLYACVTAQLISVLPKLDALTSLLDHIGVPREIIKSVKKFSSNIGALVKRRNRTIHDPRVIWYGHGEVARFEVSAKGGLKFEPVVETIAELLDLRVEIDKQLTAFQTIKQDIADALPSSPYRFRLRPVRIGRPKDHFSDPSNKDA